MAWLEEPSGQYRVAFPNSASKEGYTDSLNDSNRGVTNDLSNPHRATRTGRSPLEAKTTLAGRMRVMLLTKLSSIAAGIVTLGFLAAAGGLVAQDTYKREQNADEKQTGSDSKVRQLQKERLAVLKEIAADKNGRYQQGHLTADDALQATAEVLKAELELADSDDARIRVLAQLVQIAKELEDINDQRFKAGRCPPSDRLAAKANRLEAEIELERAKAKAKRRAR